MSSRARPWCFLRAGRAIPSPLIGTTVTTPSKPLVVVAAELLVRAAAVLVGPAGAAEPTQKLSISPGPAAVPSPMPSERVHPEAPAARQVPVVTQAGTAEHASPKVLEVLLHPAEEPGALLDRALEARNIQAALVLVAVLLLAVVQARRLVLLRMATTARDKLAAQPLLVRGHQIPAAPVPHPAKVAMGATAAQIRGSLATSTVAVVVALVLSGR